MRSVTHWQEQFMFTTVSLFRLSANNANEVQALNEEEEEEDEEDEEEDEDEEGTESEEEEEEAPNERQGERQHGVYRPDIDGLRAVAVLAVLAYHMDAGWLPGGFVGVDIFFVISGYVVAGSLLSHQNQDVLAYFVNFYARRLKRLAPALVLVTVLAGLAMAVVLPPWTPDIEEFYAAGMFGLVGWSNNHFAERESAEKGGYFEAMGPGAPRNPFMHTWSLGVEEQFYFSFPAVLYVGHGQRVAKSFNWKPQWPISSVILGSGIALSLLISIPLTTWRQEFAFYTLPSRFWELAVGALIFDLESFAPLPRQRDWGFKAIVGVQAIAMLCIVLALLFTPEEDGFPFPWALLSVFGAACYIVAGSNQASYVNGLLAHKWPVYIGKLSYPIYLWHWPVIVLTDALFGNPGLRLKSAVEVFGYRAFQLLIVAVGAAVTYHWVEGCFRNWKPSMSWKVFFGLVPFILAAEVWLGLLSGPLNGALFPAQAMSGSSVLVDHTDAHIPTDKDADPNAGLEAEPDRGTLHRPGGVKISTTTTTTVCGPCRCCLQDKTFHTPPGAESCLVRNLKPCFVQKLNYDSHWQQWGDWVNSCWGWDYAQMKEKFPPIETCLTPNRGPNGKKPAVFLFGDSHAQMYVPGLRHAVSRDYAFVYATKPMRDCFIGMSSYCKRVFEHIKMLLKPGDIVAICFASWKFSAPVTISNWFHSGLLTTALDKYLRMIHYWSDCAKGRGASVLVLGDQTVLKSTGLLCVPSFFNWNASAKCARTRKSGASISRRFRTELRKLVDKVVNNAYFFDPRDLFCDDSMCGAMIPGTSTLAIGDQEHLTIEGSVYLWPFLCSFLSKHGLLPYHSPDNIPPLPLLPLLPYRP